MKNIETFDNKYDIYVITLNNEDRIKNIKIQQEKINIPIQIFDAVNGNNLDFNKLDNLKIGNNDGFIKNNEKQRKREVGCYLSHYNIYKKCKKIGYTIVFEDDFSIDVDNLIDKINESIIKLNNANIDFDIMFIGNHVWKKNHGTLIIDNLYKIDSNGETGGTHAYVINNKNINKILKETEIIDGVIDGKIQNLASTGKLNVVKIYPYYVNYINARSTIDVESFINYF
jgi:glycosyl transferase family 25